MTKRFENYFYLSPLGAQRIVLSVAFFFLSRRLFAALFGDWHKVKGSTASGQTRAHTQQNTANENGRKKKLRRKKKTKKETFRSLVGRSFIFIRSKL